MIAAVIAALQGAFGRLILIAVAALLLVLGAVAGKLAWDKNTLRAQLAEAHAAYSAREADMAHQLADALQMARTAEARNAQETAAIDAAYERGLADGQARTAATLADLRSGNLRLRHELAAAACSAAGLPGTGADAGSADDAARAELWRSSAGDLVRIADEADGVVRQLNSVLDKCEADARLRPSSGG
ncbi:MAG TPA: lysis system i-spanin subunit Rz [Steroidobacteraceae bacterium]|nr:lysis system i-spanin subunit Rz [Steroidobacteraceae bacterium]